MEQTVNHKLDHLLKLLYKAGKEQKDENLDAQKIWASSGFENIELKGLLNLLSNKDLIQFPYRQWAPDFDNNDREWEIRQTDFSKCKTVWFLEVGKKFYEEGGFTQEQKDKQTQNKANNLAPKVLIIGYIAIILAAIQTIAALWDKLFKCP